MNQAVGAPPIVKIHLKYLQGTPVFATTFADPALQRVYGFTRHKATGLCLFPAFYPFGLHVENDLSLVVPTSRLEWTPEASEQRTRNYLESTLDAKRDIPSTFTWHTPPYAHQLEAVARVLHNPRFGLFLDCGLGKTKTMLDAYRVLRDLDPDSKMLVVCPGHLPRIWEREAEIHGNGEIDLLAIVDASSRTPSPTRRWEMLTGRRAVDVLPGTWFAEECPDVLYAPLSLDAPQEMLDIEREYVRACQAGDQKAMTNARNRLRYRAKKYEVELPPSAKYLDPPPRAAKEYDVVVMSYSLARPDKDDLAIVMDSVPYNIIVADESHGMRSYNSKRTKGMRRLAVKAPRRYIMSGTPALGDPMHLYGQLSFLGNFLVGDWWTYTRRYVVYAEYGGRKMPVGFQNLHVLNEVTSEVSTRMKVDDCLDLPEINIVTRPVYVDAETRDLYNETVAQFTATLYDRVVKPAHSADRLNKLLQILSGFVTDSNVDEQLCDDCPYAFSCEANEIRPYTPDCKVIQERPPKTILRLPTCPRRDHLKGLLEEVLESVENKVIVWCQFREELDMVEELLVDEKISFVRVDGSTRDSVKAQDKFNDDPSCRVYLSQIATGIGITLNAANYTIYYGVSYSLDHFEQSMKRNHRSGQTRKVTVYLLETPGSVHEFVFAALRRKQDISATLTDVIRCGTCALFDQCSRNGTQPFDDGCVYNDKARRVVTRPALL